jgi:hypothetical protein
MDLFPEAALAILRQARFDANASHQFEIMSGGFAWSDERLAEVAPICTPQDNWSFRILMGYRASLTRDAPREELRAPWDQLLRECPDWPGFRPERRSPTLAAELEREGRRSCVGLRRAMREFEKQKGENLE